MHRDPLQRVKPTLVPHLSLNSGPELHIIKSAVQPLPYAGMFLAKLNVHRRTEIVVNLAGPTYRSIAQFEARQVITGLISRKGNQVALQPHRRPAFGKGRDLL